MQFSYLETEFPSLFVDLLILSLLLFLLLILLSLLLLLFPYPVLDAAHVPVRTVLLQERSCTETL
jgi:hypothetical protein